MLQEVLKYNREFVENGGYKPHITSALPDKKVAILTCMDTRLVELLPAAIGFKNGDVKILKNAGAVISHPYGSVVRSLIVAIYKQGVESVWIVGHSDCGMKGIDVDGIIESMIKHGIERSVIDDIANSGVDFQKWLGGFCSTREAVFNAMDLLASHPLIPKDISIEGLIIDSTTGELSHIRSIEARK
ncbi:MAG: carbonic anhydrase [Rikenellaceae bacterium]